MIKQGRGYVSNVRENQGSTEPFNWSVINLSIFILTYQMQGRFKMEYRSFTIVRYNYKDYNKVSVTRVQVQVHCNCTMIYDVCCV